MRRAFARVLATSEKAKQKNLSLVAGFCWRYNDMIQDTFQQLQDGAHRQAWSLTMRLITPIP